MEFRVEISGLESNMSSKAWMKEDIRDVFLGSHGGWAIGGNWTWRNRTFPPLTFRPLVPGTAVVGVTLFEDSQVFDRVAFLMDIDDLPHVGLSTYAPLSSSIVVSVEGPFHGTNVRGILANPVSATEKASTMPDVILEYMRDPFYWAAVMLNQAGTPSRNTNPKEIPLMREEIKPTPKEKPALELYAKEHVYNKAGQMIGLPKGIHLAYDMNGIALLAYDHNGATSLGLADALLASGESLKPELVDWIKEQSREYRVLAESLKIIALANTQDKKGENMQ